MSEISGFPYFEVEFDKKGRVHDPEQVQRAVDAVDAGGATDLFVISHGWNNHMAEARELYGQFFGVLRGALDDGPPAELAGRRFAVLAVLWPSKKFADKELIPTGAASIGSAVSDRAVEEQLEALRDAFDAPDADARLERARELVPELEDSADARREYADLLRSLLAPSDEHEGEVPRAFFTVPGDTLMDRLAKPGMQAGPPPGGGLDGGGAPAGPGGSAAGLGQILGGIKGAASNLANFVTYYQMKERAGTVGRGGVNEVLRELRERSPGLRIHLVGHSFGGRLVTAAADGPAGQPPVVVDTMTLLQAAFSHNGFASKWNGEDDGLFRRVVTEGRVRGPILVSHTVNDKAVGVAYPLASRIANQVASALGDRNDPFGGIGRNGAQNTPEAVDGQLLAVGGGSYAFDGGKRVFNLGADAFITGHSDICKPEVARAVLAAVART